MAWDEQSASTGLDECAALVRSAEALCSSAPELAVQLAQRALAIGTGITARDPMAFADVGQARSLSMRAQAVLAGGLVRISHYADAVEPAFAALALAEVTSATEFAAAVRLDLAVCAREVGEPVLGGVVLRPVLESDVRPSLRAFALSRLVTCVGHLARRDDLEDALAEADRLVAADDRLSPDARRIERARLSVRTAAYHRWYGDTEDAVAAAKAGLGMLNRLRREMRAECDRLRAQLVLELVCALLDEGELAEAESAAETVVGQPVRATSAAAVGQLMLAVSTRVLLPSGQVARGREMLAQSVWMAERHGLDALLADSLTEVSLLDEQAGRTADALEALRSARAAEQRRMQAIARASRLVLTEVGSADVGAKAVTSLLRQASRSGHTVPAPHAERGDRADLAVEAGSLSTSAGASASAGAGASATAQETPDLLNREGLIRRLRSVRNGERPVALTLLRFEPLGEGAQEGSHRADIDLTELAGRVRAIAPDHAELASSAGDELAVLLPHTTRDQAERFAATIRETARATDWPADKKGNDLSISTGVVQSAAPTADNDTVDGGALLTAARHALSAPDSPSEPRVPRPTRLHAAGTTPADRDPRAAANTVGTRSGYFHLPTTDPDATGAYAVPGPAETARDAAASASEAADTAREAAARSTGARRARSADTPFGDDEEPTRPLPNVAGASESLTVGRAILSSLSIPKGSGGRRRAPGEQTANTQQPVAESQHPTWPNPPGPRTTDDPKPGWPQTPGPREAGETNPDWPSWSTTQDPNADWPPSTTPQPSREDEAKAEQTKAKAEQDKRSAYEQTKAELARMMSALTAGNQEIPPPSKPDSPSRATIPTPPDPDPIPEPDRRPEIPDPPDPDPIPPTPEEPQPVEPGPPPASEPIRETATTSALRAALEPFGGLPERSGPPDTSRNSRPPGPAKPTGPDWSPGATTQESRAGSAETTNPTAPSNPAEPTGRAGSSDPAGLAGSSGMTGPTGSAGWTGSSDSAGLAGLTGSTGQTGSSDPAGLSGSTGMTGSTGHTGFSDPADPAGSAGLGGSSGSSGSAGTAGAGSEETRSEEPAKPTWSAGSAETASSTLADWAGETSGSTPSAGTTGSPEITGSPGAAGPAEAHTPNAIDWSADIARPRGAPEPTNSAAAAWSTDNTRSGEAPDSGDAARPAQNTNSASIDWSADTASSGSTAGSAAIDWSADIARPGQTARPTQSAGSAAIDWSADIVRSGDSAAAGTASSGSTAQSAGSAGIDWSADTVRSGESTGIDWSADITRSGETPRPPSTPAAIDWSADITRPDENSSSGETSITANEPLIGPRPRPPDTPGTRGRQRGERSDSTTIAGLLAEALAAYQSTADDEDDYHPPRQEPAKPTVERFNGLDPFADSRQQYGVHGRHRSPE